MPPAKPVGACVVKKKPASTLKSVQLQKNLKGAKGLKEWSLRACSSTGKAPGSNAKKKRNGRVQAKSGAPGPKYNREVYVFDTVEMVRHRLGPGALPPRIQAALGLEPET